MIKLAVAASEKWYASLSAEFRKNDSAQAEIVLVRKQVGDYESGILSDMNIASEVASMVVRARRSMPQGHRAIDAFDTAAEKLAMDDQARYYLTKARVYAEVVPKITDRDSLMPWIEVVVSAYCRAAENGCEPRKAVGSVRKVLDDAGLKTLFLDQYTCRIYQSYSSSVPPRVQILRAAHKEKDALDLAVKAMKDLSPLQSLKPGDCALVDTVELVKHYDARFVVPVVKQLAKDADAFLLETCDRYWEMKPLVVTLLPRVRSTSRQALDAFKRAGVDEAYRNDKQIALTELLAWKKLGKGKEFRQLYPERYKLAQFVNYKGKAKSGR